MKRLYCIIFVVAMTLSTFLLTACQGNEPETVEISEEEAIEMVRKAWNDIEEQKHNRIWVEWENYGSDLTYAIDVSDEKYISYENYRGYETYYIVDSNGYQSIDVDINGTVDAYRGNISEEERNWHIGNFGHGGENPISLLEDWTFGFIETLEHKEEFTEVTLSATKTGDKVSLDLRLGGKTETYEYEGRLILEIVDEKIVRCVYYDGDNILADANYSYGKHIELPQIDE